MTLPVADRCLLLYNKVSEQREALGMRKGVCTDELFADRALLGRTGKIEI